MTKKNSSKYLPLAPQALQIIANRFKALSDPARLMIIQAVHHEEKNVTQICTETNLNQANVSKHLSILAEQGILSKRKDGMFSYYQVCDQSILDICTIVCSSVEDSMKNKHKIFKT